MVWCDLITRKMVSGFEEAYGGDINRDTGFVLIGVFYSEDLFFEEHIPVVHTLSRIHVNYGFAI